MNPPECQQCHHAPLLHEPDGLGEAVCLGCIFVARQIENPIQRAAAKICVTKFIFRLSQHEREQAARAPKDSFIPHAVCIECGGEWQQHTGFLCPSGDSTFLPLIDGDLPYLRKSDVEN